MTPLHSLAVRFCDSNEASRDVMNPDAVKFRLFLSAFLVYVEQNQRRGPCSACGDGDTAQKYHSHGDLLQFEGRRESE